MKVLIVRFSALGDLVLTTGPIKSLHKENPNLEIHLLTSSLGAELLQNVFEIREVHVLEKGAGLIDIIKTYKALPKFDIVFDLQGNLKSYLLKFFTKASIYKINKQSRERRAFVKNRKHKDLLKDHVVEKYYKTFHQAFNINNRSLEDLRPQLLGTPLTYNPEDFDFSQAVVVHPYASQNNKVWPKFHDFIRELLKQKHNVVIIGSHKGSPEWPDGALDLTNKTGLHEMSAIINEAKALVTTDSGPMHFGVARNTPTLAIFGPTTKEFGFYPSFANCSVVENTNLDCRPCHVHGGHTCPKKHFLCMEEIEVDTVLDQLNALLKI